MSDEARRLLEEEIKVVAISSKDAPNDAYFVGRLSSLLWVRDRILASPISAAREAALMMALRRFLGLHPFAREVGVCISCGGKAADYPKQIHYPNCLWVQIGNGVALDTSPAAAALLAERYLPFSCPNCNRIRLLYEPQSGAIRCEKCLADTETLVAFQEALSARVALAPGKSPSGD